MMGLLWCRVLRLELVRTSSVADSKLQPITCNPPTPTLPRQVGVLLGTLVMAFFSILLLLGRHQLGRLFSADAGVVLLTAQAVPPLAVSLIGEGANTVLSGIMRGCGRQKIGATVNLVRGLGVGGWVLVVGWWFVGFGGLEFGALIPCRLDVHI